MATYVVETTVHPGVQYEVSEAEYQQLFELGLLLNAPVDPVTPGVFDTEVSGLIADVNSQTYAQLRLLPVPDHTHLATDISDSGAFGRSLLATTDVVSAQAVLEVTDELAAVNGATPSVVDGALVKRSSAGTFSIPDATADTQPTSKAQVDAGLAGKADVGHTHTSADISDATAVGVELLTAADDAAARTAIGAVLGTGITEVQMLTQAAYDALAVKNATTLYVIQG